MLSPQTTSSVEATMQLASELAETLEPGAVVALAGDLGAGKTHFVKGLAEGLGYASKEVRSPTFTIVQVHEGGNMPLYHFDAYRVGSPDEFVNLGFEEYVHGDGVTVVEWPGRVEELLPDDTIWLTIMHVSSSERRIAQGRPE